VIAVVKGVRALVFSALNSLVPLSYFIVLSTLYSGTTLGPLLP